jgi:hypothetical protein
MGWPVPSSLVNGGVRVEPVTAGNCETFSRLFEAKGGPHYCWCTSYRVRNASALTAVQKSALTRSCVDSGVPIGVVASEGDEPIGWCSVAPRETYVRIASTSGVSSMHRGHSTMFGSAGFQIDGRRWFRRLGR